MRGGIEQLKRLEAAGKACRETDEKLMRAAVTLAQLRGEAIPTTRDEALALAARVKEGK
jgi:hypothetical protein